MHYIPAVTASLVFATQLEHQYRFRDLDPVLIGFLLFLGTLCALLWPVATAGRLLSLGISRRWVLAFAVPWISFGCAVLWGGKWWALGALLAVVATELPLLLIKGNTTATNSSDEPAA